jgi:hypothetical protein
MLVTSCLKTTTVGNLTQAAVTAVVEEDVVAPGAGAAVAAGAGATTAT